MLYLHNGKLGKSYNYLWFSNYQRTACIRISQGLIKITGFWAQVLMTESESLGATLGMFILTGYSSDI